ncbi:hypothetical protein BaRGS_00035243, partial [Batillaria attramentaria]
AKTSCEIPAVFEGDPANLTCIFNEDVSVTKRNIKIVKCGHDTAGCDPDTIQNVLDCHWLDADNIHCDLKHGFELIGQVGARAVVRIIRATQNHIGRYMCEVVPSDPSQIKPCEFYLKEEKASISPEQKTDACQRNQMHASAEQETLSRNAPEGSAPLEIVDKPVEVREFLRDIHKIVSED